MKKFLTLSKLIALTLVCVSIFLCTSCSFEDSSNTENGESWQSESVDLSTLVTVGEDYLIIVIDSTYCQITSTTVLADYMKKLKNDGVIDYTVANGMLVKLNGEENASDWSKCWMLYSNDTSVTNASYGTREIDGEVYQSAAVGMDVLPIKNGFKYVWSYDKF